MCSQQTLHLTPACHLYVLTANSAGAAHYSCLFPAFITDLRARFGQPNLTFVYVQIAAYAPDLTKSLVTFRTDYAPIRAAQDAALLLPRVGARAIYMHVGARAIYMHVGARSIYMHVGARSIYACGR